MDDDSYKDFKVSRGINYHYYFSAAQAGKPTLLFSHGFPSTSWDWHHQVAFFKELGYGLVVPDMLGYGGTDKPTDAALYRHSLMTKDVIEILDEEKVDKAIAVGHDWGSSFTSRLATYYRDRFLGFAFFAVPYNPPSQMFDFDKVQAMYEKVVGYGAGGYWKFFCEDGADKVVEEHLDSFYSILFPVDSKIWVTDWAPVGKLKEWCLSDKKNEPASYLSEKDKKVHQANLMKGGLAAPFCWYKAYMFNHTPGEEADIPKELYTVTKPVFFGAALRDYVGVAALGKQSIKQFCPDATIIDFDTDHWVPLAAPDKVNGELLKWVQGLEEKASSASSL